MYCYDANYADYQHFIYLTQTAMINKLLVSIIFGVFLLSCEKDCPCDTIDEVITDRQIRFDFQFGSTVWNSTTSAPGEILPEQYSLLRFNLFNYENVYSEQSDPHSEQTDPPCREANPEGLPEGQFG
jgi:hypothetical protein